jgi:hypothetical protein
MPKARIEGEITMDKPFSTLGRGDFFYLQYANVLMMKALNIAGLISAMVHVFASQRHPPAGSRTLLKLRSIEP